MFQSEGCLKDGFPIPVVATSDKHFSELQQHNSSPMSPLEITVHGLKGQHRIAAARNFLVGRHWWWPVAIYRELTDEQKVILFKTNFSIPYTDRQILLKILQGNEDWKCRFTGDDSRILLRLIKYQKVWEALSRLTCFVHLWDNVVNLSAFRCLSITRHAPELVRYLEGIYDFWSSLPATCADRHSVSFLNPLCLQIGYDKAAICKALNNCSLFPKLDAVERDNTRDIVFASRTMLIPTLISFFDNLR